MPDKLIALMYESWATLDRGMDGLTPEEATTRHDVGSCIAWTLVQSRPPRPVNRLPQSCTGPSARLA